MNRNISQIMLRLHGDILSAKYCGPDFNPGTPIELADHQPVMRTGVVYLVSSERAITFLSDTLIEPGTTLMVSDVTEPGSFCNLTICQNITVVEFCCSFFSMYNQLVHAISQHFRSAQLVNIVQNSPNQNSLMNFWQQIRCKTLHGTIEIKEQLRQICPDLKPFLRLIVIAPDDSHKDYEWSIPLQALQSALPDCHLFFSSDEVEGQIIGFQFFDLQNFGALENKEGIQSVLKEYQLHMMVSNSTRDYSKLNTIYSLTRRAGLIAQRLNIEPEERIYQYERYSMYQIIDLCTQRYMSLFNHSDIINLAHPLVVHLTRYDEKHRTNLRDVLFYYLLNSQDIKHTAEMLFMHRNTVSNKINQIRSICDIDFEDGGLCQRLLFSCQVMLYYERVLNQRLMRREYNQ